MFSCEGKGKAFVARTLRRCEYPDMFTIS